MKRIFDVTVAVFVLLLFLPIGLVVAFLVLVDMGRPILYVQLRPGFKGKPFKIYKFKTMRNPSPDGLIHQSDAELITRFGCILRSSSLDELPQLWNVIKGDMSLVGPRPLLMAYLPLYNERQRRRHDVRPGVTGWAQVNGRNNLSWQTKFEFDVWYVENQSFLLDLKILVMTIKKVLKREGITSRGQETSVPFEGNVE